MEIGAAIDIFTFYLLPDERPASQTDALEVFTSSLSSYSFSPKAQKQRGIRRKSVVLRAPFVEVIDENFFCAPVKRHEPGLVEFCTLDCHYSPVEIYISYIKPAYLPCSQTASV